MSLVEYIEKSTLDYLASTGKSKRKAYGQFFTPSSIAQYMGSLLLCRKTEYSILDAGAGSGILSAAVLDRKASFGNPATIHLDAYENNPDIVPLLKSNLDYAFFVLRQNNIILNYRVMETNFITQNQFAWTGLDTREIKYDVVVSNPPYKKIAKNSPEALVMNEIVHGQPNLYFLFMAMGARLLKENGEFIFIVPRSFSSGLYFTAFRHWFFDNMAITHLHLFDSRDSVFQHDNILQETIILRAEKNATCKRDVLLTQCADSNSFSDLTAVSIPYPICVKNDRNAFLFLPTSEEDIAVLEFVNQWSNTLSDSGYRMKTGIVVDFREKEWLRTQAGEHTIPLLWAYNFDKHRVEFPCPNDEKPQYLFASEDTARLQMKIANYVLLKRFTSKEERRRLQCALLFKDDFAQYPGISTENHLNFITKIGGELTREEMFGLFVVINSTYMDRYFRILNGSTQVNANEINSIPFPSADEVMEMGRTAEAFEHLDEEICDRILEDKYAPQTVLSQNRRVI